MYVSKLLAATTSDALIPIAAIVVSGLLGQGCYIPQFFFLAVSIVKIFFSWSALLICSTCWVFQLKILFGFCLPLFINYLYITFLGSFLMIVYMYYFCWKYYHRWWPPILFLMLFQLTTCTWRMFIPSFSLLLLLYLCHQMRFYAKVVGPFVKCCLWFRCVLVCMHSEAFALLCKANSSNTMLSSFFQFHMFCNLYRRIRLMLSVLTNTNLTQRSFTIVTFLRVRLI